WEAEPDSDDRALYGLAFTYTMMGEDEQALPLWETLRQRYPQAALFNDAVAHTRRRLHPSPDALTPLLEALTSESAPARVLAASSLLTEPFFYLLDETTLDQII